MLAPVPPDVISAQVDGRDRQGTCLELIHELT